MIGDYLSKTIDCVKNNLEGKSLYEVKHKWFN